MNHLASANTISPHSVHICTLEVFRIPPVIVGFEFMRSHFDNAMALISKDLNDLCSSR